MTRRVRLMVVVLLTTSLLGLLALPASAGTCPLYRFVTTGSCW